MTLQRRWIIFGTAGLTATFALAFGLNAMSGQDEPKGEEPKGVEVAPKPKLVSAAPNEIIQEFPTGGNPQTAWKIHWATSRGHGLYIQDAWFQRAPDEPFFQVLGDLRLGEMFVPYHSGSPRFWDVSYNFNLLPLTKDDAGERGKLLNNNVCMELKDRGVMWMNVPRGTKRGQSLILWGCIDAANYRYITEYGFQDDGVITVRVGSTGRNYSSREFEGHMHNGLWRIDLNVDGPDHNSVFVMEHQEPDADRKEKARTVSRPFNDGVEGAEDVKIEKFTMLSVVSTERRNARGKQIAYDVVVPRMGSARHFGSEDEGCTQHDYWVTKNRPGEMLYKKVPQFVKDGEPIMNTDVVLWISTPCHHEPRSEDGEMRGNSFTGATPVAWTGFELRPRNVFDRTPHYSYTPKKK